MKDAFTYRTAEFRGGHFEETEMAAVQEVPLTIYLNDYEVVTLLCTGKHPKYLSVGFLKSDGLITDAGQLEEIRVEAEAERIEVYIETTHDPFELQSPGHLITSGCGKGTDFERSLEAISATRVMAKLAVSPRQILQLMAALEKRSTLYHLTKGCHNAALATPESILVFHEDIGRHNAIDMICGQCFLDAIPTEDKLIVTTGRIAAEILLKAIRLGVPVLASGAAATRLSIDLAIKTNMTLIGQVEERRMVVYHSGGRVVDL